MTFPVNFTTRYLWEIRIFPHLKTCLFFRVSIFFLRIDIRYVLTHQLFKFKRRHIRPFYAFSFYNKTQYIFCYSIEVRNGIEYSTSKGKKHFWTFIRTKTLHIQFQYILYYFFSIVLSYPLCSGSTATGKAADLYFKKNVIAFIGPACAFALEPVAKLASYWNVPIITGIGDQVCYFDINRLIINIEPVIMDPQRALISICIILWSDVYSCIMRL